MTARLAIGIGCRNGVTPEAVVRIVKDALSRVEGRPVALFTVADKVQERSLPVAAALLGLPLVHLPRADLEAAAGRAQTRSERVVQLFQVPSVAECAALAGAGATSRLVLPRIQAEGVTCAIASEGSP